jgi:uncharacterized protein
MSHFLKPPWIALVFYAIALGLAVLVRFLVPLIGEASLPLTMLTPAIATLIILTLVAPEGGFRQSIKSLGFTHTGLKGWPLAILGPAVIQASSLVILAVTGLAVVTAPLVEGPVIGVIVKIATGVVIGTLFALAEEVGWRGYMLPRLMGVGALPAMLLVGLLHGMWHMPLLLTTDYYHSSGNPLLVAPLFLITLTIAGIFYGFLRLWTGSIWPVAVAHSAANMTWEISTEMIQTKTAMTLEYVGGESGLIMIGGLLIFGFILAPRIASIPRSGTR